MYKTECQILRYPIFCFVSFTFDSLFLGRVLDKYITFFPVYLEGGKAVKKFVEYFSRPTCTVLTPQLNKAVILGKKTQHFTFLCSDKQDFLFLI